MKFDDCERNDSIAKYILRNHSNDDRFCASDISGQHTVNNLEISVCFRNADRLSNPFAFALSKSKYYDQKYIFFIFSGIDANIICTTVSAEVVLSFSSHSFVMPTVP